MKTPVAQVARNFFRASPKPITDPVAFVFDQILADLGADKEKSTANLRAALSTKDYPLAFVYALALEAMAAQSIDRHDEDAGCARGLERFEQGARLLKGVVDSLPKVAPAAKTK